MVAHLVSSESMKVKEPMEVAVSRSSLVGGDGVAEGSGVGVSGAGV